MNKCSSLRWPFSLFPSFEKKKIFFLCEVFVSQKLNEPLFGICSLCETLSIPQHTLVMLPPHTHTHTVDRLFSMVTEGHISCFDLHLSLRLCDPERASMSSLCLSSRPDGGTV